jgi:hypothetical protein
MIARWTHDRDKRLAELLMEGLSASRIAAAMRDGTSRNAVIGRIYRLANPTPRAPRPRPIVQRAPDQPLVEDEIILPTSLCVTIADLHQGMCKWPFGKSPYLFCGAKSSPSSSYCRQHTLLGLSPEGRLRYERRFGS